MVTRIVLAVLLLALPAASVSAQPPPPRQDGLGGVLDALGGWLGVSPQTVQGVVVLARDTTLVLRTADQQTYRIDTAGVPAEVRARLAPGQAVSVSTRGGAPGAGLTATDIQMDAPEAAAAAGRDFRRVGGTVEETTAERVLFRTREGLVLPVDVSRVRGLPSLPPNQPATLIYEQGPRQEIVGVWIEPGDVTAGPAPGAPGWPAASPPGAAGVPAGVQTVHGLVDSVGIGQFQVQTGDGRWFTVETAELDRRTREAIRPGDIVTVTGRPGTAPQTLIAQSVQRDERRR